MRIVDEHVAVERLQEVEQSAPDVPASNQTYRLAGQLPHQVAGVLLEDAPIRPQQLARDNTPEQGARLRKPTMAMVSANSATGSEEPFVVSTSAIRACRAASTSIRSAKRSPWVSPMTCSRGAPAMMSPVTRGQPWLTTSASRSTTNVASFWRCRDVPRSRGTPVEFQPDDFGAPRESPD